jgi:hypothetical protein
LPEREAGGEDDEHDDYAKRPDAEEPEAIRLLLRPHGE